MTSQKLLSQKTLRLKRGILLSLLIVFSAKAATAEDSFGFKVKAFTFAQSGYVQAFAVETKNHVLVIDAGATPAHAANLSTYAEARNKPILKILITHGHVDHYAGAYALTDDLSQIATTKGVARQIHQYDAINYDRFGAPAPTGDRVPKYIIKDGETVQVDGVTFTAFDSGPGESYSDAWFMVTDGKKTAAFVGDLIMYGIHAFMQSGHSRDWLYALEELKTHLPANARLYLGHDVESVAKEDVSRDKSIIDWQVARINDFRNIVLERTEGRRLLTAEEMEGVVADVSAKAPENLTRYNFLISTSANVLAAELMMEREKENFEIALKQILTRR